MPHLTAHSLAVFNRDFWRVTSVLAEVNLMIYNFQKFLALRRDFSPFGNVFQLQTLRTSCFQKFFLTA